MSGKTCPGCGVEKTTENTRWRVNGKYTFLRTNCKSCEAKQRAGKTTIAEKIELERLRSGDSHTSNELRERNKFLQIQNDQLKELLNVAKLITKAPRLYLKAQNEPSKGSIVPILTASDWHIEERVEKDKVRGLNEFNLEIAEDRCKLFFINALKLYLREVRDSKVAYSILNLIGDFITGAIHEELMRVCALTPPQAIVVIFGWLRDGIRFLLENTDCDWWFNCNVGNHERTTKQMHVAMAVETSLAYILYKFLEAEFQDKRCHWNICTGKMIEHQVFPNFRLRTLHGDDINYGGGVGGLTIPLNKAIGQWDVPVQSQLTIAGHWHQYFDGGNFIINGSLIGVSPYSQSIKARFEPPRQSFCVIHSEHGKATTAPVWVT